MSTVVLLKVLNVLMKHIMLKTDHMTVWIIWNGLLVSCTEMKLNESWMLVMSRWALKKFWANSHLQISSKWCFTLVYFHKFTLLTACTQVVGLWACWWGPLESWMYQWQQLALVNCIGCTNDISDFIIITFALGSGYGLPTVILSSHHGPWALFKRPALCFFILTEIFS